MKLVEILARELKEWPEKAKLITQDSNLAVFAFCSDKKLPVCRDSGFWYSPKGLDLLMHDFGFNSDRLASDHSTAIVTRSEWKAERARIAKTAKKPNKDGWIRHRGGKCPVEAGVIVEIRDRDGDIYEYNCSDMRWNHIGSGADIMAYRIYKPAEQPVIDLPQGYGEVITATLENADGPLQWRDRIREIDRTVEALEEERVSLIQRLECEGLQLLPAKVCAPAHHAYDWQVSSVTEGKFIQAIKQHRNLYGSGLKEAKEAVEQYRDANTPSA